MYLVKQQYVTLITILNVWVIGVKDDPTIYILLLIADN